MPLKDWIVNWVQPFPQLNTVRRLRAQDTFNYQHRDQDPDTNIDLRITTFTNGTDSLFHFRQQMQYFHAQAVDGFEEWHLEVTERRLAVRFSDAMALYLAKGKTATLPEVVWHRHPHLVNLPPIVNEAFEDGCCNMTSYCGSPVPHNLLKEIYQESGHSWGWKTGTRGLPLPAHVWVSLQSWKSGLDATNPII